MLVVLRVISGSGPGRHVQIRSEQVLKVGRSGWADLCVAGDSKLLDIHYSVSCGSEGCVVESLEKSGPTLVNRKPITRTIVYDGDIIEAGTTKFRVTIEGGPSKPVDEQPVPEKAKNPTGGTASAAAAMGLVGVCAYLEFSDDVKPMATGTDDPEELIKQLADKKKFQDAIRLRAYLLDKRQAVWWGCLCLNELIDGALPPDQVPAVNAAAEWVKDPTEEQRRRTETAAADSKYSGPGATLALSAFWSNGSLAPEGSEDVPPDERLTSQGVTAALVMAAYLGEPTHAESRYGSFLDKGSAIADGSAPLPTK